MDVGILICLVVKPGVSVSAQSSLAVWPWTSYSTSLINHSVNSAGRDALTCAFTTCLNSVSKYTLLSHSCIMIAGCCSAWMGGGWNPPPPKDKSELNCEFPEEVGRLLQADTAVLRRTWVSGFSCCPSFLGLSQCSVSPACPPHWWTLKILK